MSGCEPGQVTGVVLAGGAGRRMGGADKGLERLHGEALASRALRRLRPQVAALLISANRNLDAYAAFGVPVVADAVPDFAGPLAGLLAGLERACTPYVVSVPCDTPDFPQDLVARLCEALAGGAPAAYALAGGRHQPVFCLAHRRVAPQLRAYLDGGGRRMREWMASVGAAVADFGDDMAPFDNLNTALDLARHGTSC
jgi:molybdopterin-guanine dinucleotide biosynthesis protein A